MTAHGIDQALLWNGGVHSELFNPSFRSKLLRQKWNAKDKKVILCSSMFQRNKDLEVVLGIYDRMKQEGREDVLMVMEGKGPLESQLKRKMPDARFVGQLVGEDKAQALILCGRKKI